MRRAGVSAASAARPADDADDGDSLSESDDNSKFSSRRHVAAVVAGGALRVYPLGVLSIEFRSTCNVRLIGDGPATSFRLDYPTDCAKLMYATFIASVDIDSVSCTRHDAMTKLIMDSPHFKPEFVQGERITMLLPYGSCIGTRIRNIYERPPLASTVDSRGQQRHYRYAEFDNADQMIDCVKFDTDGHYIPDDNEPLLIQVLRSNQGSAEFPRIVEGAPIERDAHARPTAKLLTRKFFDVDRVRWLYPNQLTGSVVSSKTCELSVSFVIRAETIRVKNGQ